MKQASYRIAVVSLGLLLLFSASVMAQGSSQTSAMDIYGLRKLTNQDWQRMSTTQRLEALGAANAHAINQTFIGDFSLDTDLYPRWGYDYYEMEDRYQNYSFRGFENYVITNDRRNRWFYNQFGDRLTRMTTSGQLWWEKYNDDGSWGDMSPSPNARAGRGGVGPGGYINQTEDVGGIFYIQESTDDWVVSLTGAGAIRKKLSPLVFSIPNYDGLSIDFQSANYSATFISSVPVGLYAFQPELQNFGGQFSTSIMMRAGQIRRKFGALTLGANYSNMYTIVGSRDQGHGLKGSVTDFSPTPNKYLVRVLDDSPWDGEGPIVYGVKLYVNGQYRPDIVPTVIMENLEDELITAVVDQSQYNYVDLASEVTNQYGSEKVPIDQVTLHQRVPKFIDYLYYDDYIKGHGLNNINIDPVKGPQIMNMDLANKMYKIIDPGGKPIVVNGNEIVTYMFDLTSMGREQVTSVQAEVTVSNDYKVQLAEIYPKIPTSSRDDPSGSSYFMYYGATFWKTMAQADGNIKDESNLRNVMLDFAFEVANTITSVDAHFNYLGFKIDGEYATNTHFYQFSDGTINSGVPSTIPSDLTPRQGKRSNISDNAYYLTLQKDWDNYGFGVAGEVFRMGKFFRPDFMVFLPKIESNMSVNCKNEFIRMTLVEDNDDNDQYPDVQPAARVLAWRYGALVDPDGVFPGKDLDHDSVPDTDLNQNGIPDYNEPFLMLNSDPDQFVTGDDVNNNTIPDVIEDDLKDDTPYDLDRQGYHLNFRYSPLRNLDVILGSFRTHGIGLDTRNNSDYVKTLYTYNVLDIGHFNIEYRYQRIKDNIADPAMIPDETTIETQAAGRQRGSRYKSKIYFDELEYRNSNVNRLFVNAALRPTSAISVINTVRYENNGQNEGMMYDSVFQPKSTITTLAISNMVTYTREFKGIIFSPGLKFRLYKKAYETFTSPRDHYLMTIPLMTFRYQVSPVTFITLGFQGFTGLETDFTDYVLARNSYKQKNTLLQIENRSNYFGFEVWGAAGFQMEEVDFDMVDRKFEEYKTSSLFMRVWVGYE